MLWFSILSLLLAAPIIFILVRGMSAPNEIPYYKDKDSILNALFILLVLGAGIGLFGALIWVVGF